MFEEKQKAHPFLQ